MNITPQKRRDARRRATCVRELRRWRDRKRNRPPIAQVIADLQARYPDLPLSRRSLYRWSDRAGDPIGTARLVDARGGSSVRAMTFRAASIARRWWLERGSSTQPTRAELRLVARLGLCEDARLFAHHRLRIARLMVGLERAAGLPPHTAARHLIDCLHLDDPGIRVSVSSAVAWSRLYRERGAARLATRRYRGASRSATRSKV